MKKPRVAFTVADDKHAHHAKMLINSLRKFHSEEELPLVWYDQEKLDKIKDPEKFYRFTPMIAKDLLKEYELVIKLDADQIILGSLEHMFNAYDNYDVGTVLNINRVDPMKYGLVSFATIQPNEYYNCGLVAMRSEDFVNKWWKLCQSPHYYRTKMREQDMLNILCHYHNYKVRCFDYPDGVLGQQTWNGLVAKGESMRMYLDKNKNVILPRGEDNYPDRDVVIKAYHWAGGDSDPQKMNYRLIFNEDLIEYIDYLVGDENGKEEK